MKPKHWYCETWQQSFWLMECWPSKNAESALRKLGFFEQEIGHQQGRTMWRLDGTGPIVIWTKPEKNLSKRAAILAHECVHAAHICLGRAGVKPDFDNDEAVTYLVTALVQRAWR